MTKLPMSDFMWNYYQSQGITFSDREQASIIASQLIAAIYSTSRLYRKRGVYYAASKSAGSGACNTYCTAYGGKGNLRNRRAAGLNHSNRITA